MKAAICMAFAAIILISAANAIQALENRDLAVLEVPIYADPTMTSNLQRRSTTLQGVQAEWSYWYIPIQIGTPAQTVRLVVDTGSSDVWVNMYTSDFCKDPSNGCGRNGMFDSSASHSLATLTQSILISYVDGTKISGPFVTDILYVASKKLEEVQFGTALESNSPDGVFGLGYAANQAQAVNDGTPPYDTILDHLFNKRLIKTRAYSLWLDSHTDGHILFGGIDHAKFDGELTTLPIQKVRGNYGEFIVTLKSIIFSRGGKKLVSPVQNQFSVDVLLDVGASSTHLPPRITTYIHKMLNVILEDNGKTPRVDCSLAQSKLKMVFIFGSRRSGFVEIPVSMSQLVRPDGEYCKAGFYPPLIGRAIIGHNILSSIYTVYDLTANKVSLAPTKRGVMESDIVEINTGDKELQKDENGEIGSDQSENLEDSGTVEGKITVDPNNPSDLENQDGVLRDSADATPADQSIIVTDHISAGVDDSITTPIPINELADAGNLGDGNPALADPNFFLGSTGNEDIKQGPENDGLFDTSKVVKRVPITFCHQIKG